MIWWIVGIVVALAIFSLVALEIQRRWPHFDKAAVGLQGIATTMAIMFAGYWYIYERKGQPQANTDLKVIGIKVADDAVMIDTRFTIHNLGATVLEAGDVDVRLQDIGPDSLPIDRIRQLGPTKFPDRIDGKDVYDNGILMWRTVRWFKGGDKRRIEPGEEDPRIVDFIVDCSHKAMRVFVALQRPGGTDGWLDQADVSLTKLCSGPVGAKDELSVSDKD